MTTRRRLEARRPSKPLQMREDYAFKVSRLGVPACAGDVVNASLVLAAQTIRESPRSLRTTCYDRSGS